MTGLATMPKDRRTVSVIQSEIAAFPRDSPAEFHHICFTDRKLNFQPAAPDPVHVEQCTAIALNCQRLKCSRDGGT
jgi:hypothetical protein